MTGLELKELRNIFGYSRAKLALRIGVHPDTIRYWERKPWFGSLAEVPAQILKAFGLGFVDVDMALKSPRFRQLCGVYARAYTCASWGLIETKKP